MTTYPMNRTYNVTTARRAGASRIALAWQNSARLRRQVTLFLAAAILAVARFTSTHGLVVGGLALFTVAAGMLALPAGVVVAGFGLMFLEWRRR